MARAFSMPRAKLLTAGLLATLALGSVTPAAMASGAPGPGCDAIRGATVARNDAWRIARLPIHGEARKARVIACRVADRTNAPVRVLGTTGTWNAAEFFRVTQLVGSLALVAWQFDNGSSARGDHDVAVIELAHGTRRALPESSWPDVSYNGRGRRAASSIAALSSSGGLATTVWRGVVRDGYHHDPDPTPLRLVNHAGPLRPGTMVDTIVPASSGSAVYVRSREGPADRLSVRGPMPEGFFSPSRALRWQYLRLNATGERDVIAELPGDHRGTAFDVVRFRNGSGVRWREDDSQRTTPLAPGGERSLRVLAADLDQLVVSARFADAPDRREIRVISLLAEGRAARLPGRPDTEAPGQAAAGWGGAAVASADGIWVLPAVSGYAAEWIPRPGLHDLAVEDWTVYATDASGRAVTIPLA